MGEACIVQITVIERTNINQQTHGYFTWKEGTFLIPTQIPCATSEAQGGRGGHSVL
jgi:hypothetical protein